MKNFSSCCSPSCSCLFLFPPSEQNTPGAVDAQVITEKGSLNLLSQASDSAEVIARLSNGVLVEVKEKGGPFCKVALEELEGYAMTKYLSFSDIPSAALAYTPLQKRDQGDAVTAMKLRLRELGYFRESGNLTDEYNDTCAERIRIFRRVNGLKEDGSANQILLHLLYSSDAKANTEPLPQARRLNSCIVTPDTSGAVDWNQFAKDNPDLPVLHGQRMRMLQPYRPAELMSSPTQYNHTTEERL